MSATYDKNVTSAKANMHEKYMAANVSTDNIFAFVTL